MLIRDPAYNLMTFSVFSVGGITRVGDSPFGRVIEPRPLAEPGAIFQAEDPGSYLTLRESAQIELSPPNKRGERKVKRKALNAKSAQSHK